MEWSNGGTKPVKVLLADDEPAVQRVVGRRLEASGYQVIAAMDGNEALQKARREIPDVIVLDVMMPKMSGDAVAQQLKDDDATARIPVIFLTCLVTPDESFQPRNVIGNNLILPKPLDSNRLLAMIREVTGR